MDRTSKKLTQSNPSFSLVTSFPFLGERPEGRNEKGHEQDLSSSELFPPPPTFFDVRNRLPDGKGENAFFIGFKLK